MMDARWEKLTEALATLQDRLGETPEVAITLGSGLSKAFGVPDGGRIVPANEIPHYPQPTVAGHAGEFWAGRIGDNTAGQFDIIDLQGAVDGIGILVGNAEGQGVGSRRRDRYFG